MQAQVAVVDVHRLAAHARGLERHPQQLFQAVGEEDCVRIHLDDPVVLPRAFILHHCVPETDEDTGVERRFELAAARRVEAALHETGLHTVHYGQCGVGVDRVLVAAVENSQLCLCLRPDKAHLVAERHHQCCAEKRWRVDLARGRLLCDLEDLGAASFVALGEDQPTRLQVHAQARLGLPLDLARLHDRYLPLLLRLDVTKPPALAAEAQLEWRPGLSNALLDAQTLSRFIG
mmetsp:Transcript_57965/g.149165  ORF Transcript_57965/g.149165 Transcript_57965/m.149165 type:complete len:233 (-) Transcript_57965:731-1429(-)